MQEVNPWHEQEVFLGNGGHTLDLILCKPVI